MTSGRTSTYTPEMAARICERIMDGQSLLRICKEPGMPSRYTVINWRNKHPEFRDLFDAALEIKCHLMVDELLDIADDDSDDWTTDKEGNAKVNSEAIARSRVRIDTRKWIAGKVLHDVYGDRQTNQNVNTSHEEWVKRMEQLRSGRGGPDSGGVQG